jgi:hypothetical protein
MIKQFRIPQDKEREVEKINIFLKENPEYEYLAYLNAMELYMDVKNGNKVVIDCDKYNELLISKNIER